MTATIRSGPTCWAAQSACQTSGLPAMGCITLGTLDFIRVPAPAARTTTAVTPTGIGQIPLAVAPTTRRRQRTGIGSALRRQDSNLKLLNQNQRCCQLHHGGSDGFGP